MERFGRDVDEKFLSYRKAAPFRTKNPGKSVDWGPTVPIRTDHWCVATEFNMSTTMVVCRLATLENHTYATRNNNECYAKKKLDDVLLHEI